ncbi:MAG: hypothetical protein ACMUIP_17320 [bacterium]
MPAFTKLDILYSENQSDSSGDQPQFIKDAESIIRSMTDLPKGQILNYFTKPESHIRSSYNKIDRETINFCEQINIPIPPCYLMNKKDREDSFISLQKWEGIVLKRMKESFLARLIDLTNDGPDEEAELPIAEISAEDLSLIEPGAIFYWNIGYLDKWSGQRTRASVIRFRRLPKWTRKEIDAAKREAEQIQEFLNWK